MKKIISILLALCMAATLCVSLVSCEENEFSENTALSQVWTYLHDETTQGKGVSIEDKEHNMTVYLSPKSYETGENYVLVLAEFPMGTGYTGQLFFDLTDGASVYTMTYSVFEDQSKKEYHGATSQISAADYTGSDYVSFDTVSNISITEEFTRRQDVTFIINNCLTMTDTFLASRELSVRDFGFVSLADRYLSEQTLKDNETAGEEVEEDLGSIFSAERFAYSGEMLLLGMGMVFLVLAILWMVLIIFAKFMGGVEKPVKTEKPVKAEPKPTPAPAPAVVTAPATAASDDAIVAAITAAIAMTIQSDPALSSQFESGFRVVSFKKKNGKTSWNH